MRGSGADSEDENAAVRVGGGGAVAAALHCRWLVRRSDCLSSSSARRRSTRSASSSPLSDRAAPLSACARESLQRIASQNANHRWPRRGLGRRSLTRSRRCVPARAGNTHPRPKGREWRCLRSARRLGGVRGRGLCRLADAPAGRTVKLRFGDRSARAGDADLRTAQCPAPRRRPQRRSGGVRAAGRVRRARPAAACMR